MRTKKCAAKFRIFLGIWIVCLIVGTVFVASNPNYLFIAIPIWVIGVVCAIIGFVFIAMEMQIENTGKENRIRKLEEEVETLKNMLQ